MNFLAKLNEIDKNRGQVKTAVLKRAKQGLEQAMIAAAGEGLYAVSIELPNEAFRILIRDWMLSEEMGFNQSLLISRGARTLEVRLPVSGSYFPGTKKVVVDDTGFADFNLG